MTALELRSINELLDLFKDSQEKVIKDNTAFVIEEAGVEGQLILRSTGMTPDEFLRYQFIRRSKLYKEEATEIDPFTGHPRPKATITKLILKNIDKRQYETLQNKVYGNKTIKKRPYYKDGKYLLLENAYKAYEAYYDETGTKLETKKQYDEAIERKETILVDSRKSQLDHAVEKIIKEYEKDGKDVFDSFTETYRFVLDCVEKNASFHKANVGRTHHELQGTNKRKSIAYTYCEGKKVNVYKNEKTNFLLNVPTILGGKFYPATFRTFMVITKIHTEGNRDTAAFSFTLTEYMDICGLKDRKEAMKQLKRDLDIIATSILQFKTRNSSGSMNMIDKWERKDRTERINVTFTQSYLKEIQSYPTGYISASALRLNINSNPNSIHFEFKINQHKRSNFGKPNEDIISVKTLLNGANIPTYKEVQEQSESFNRIIVKPFERDMSALDDRFTWEYCGEKGRPLTDQELREFTHDQFIGFYVKITWKEYPDQTQRIANKSIANKKAVKSKK